MYELSLDPYHRRSIRLKGYDYSLPGAYFVTVLSFHQKPVFGSIKGGLFNANIDGNIVRECWYELDKHYPYINLDAFVVMPNHIHGILFIEDTKVFPGHDVRAGLRPALTKLHELSAIIRAFKSFSARRINEHRKTPGTPVWQRNYYEHIIRNDREINDIREYIEANIINWDKDTENPLTQGRVIDPPSVLYLLQT
jgi:putative transposase